MTDLELLRAELRERETLAPDPNVVLTRTHAVLRRRRTARRAGALVAVAAATTGVLVAGTAFLQAGPPSPVPPAAQATLVSPAATLPFTIGYLPPGYVIDTWRLTPGDLAVDLVRAGTTGAIMVHIQDRDPAAGGGGEPRTVNGAPAVLRLVQSSQELSWELAPGKWAIVSGHKDLVAVAVLQAIADSMTPVPTPVGPSLREISAPPGLQVVFASGGDEEGGAVTFCPAPTMNPDTPGCVNIAFRAGTMPSSVLMPVPGKTKTLEDVPLAALPGSPLRVTADGRAATRQLDAGHWLWVTSPDVDPVILRTVASSGVFG